MDRNCRFYIYNIFSGEIWFVFSRWNMNKDIKDILIIWIAAIVVSIVVTIYIDTSVNAAIGGNIPTECQYPTRTSNTTDSCDNTDPCDTRQVKNSNGDCVIIEINITNDIKNVPQDLPFVPPVGGYTK